MYPVLSTIGVGFFVGILIGYAIKKVVKIVAIVVGLFFFGLAYLQYQQIVNINWNKLQPFSQNAALIVLNATKYIPGLTDVSGHTTNLTMSDLGIPLTGSMAVGFTVGFMRGWANDTTRRFVNNSRVATRKRHELMFRNLFRKLDQILDNSDVTPEQKFFSSIYGYDDINKLLLRCIIARETTHVLLTGPPASSKTVFLLEMLKMSNKAFFVDGTSSSGPGMINYLFENNVRYLLIDEIWKQG